MYTYIYTYIYIYIYIHTCMYVNMKYVYNYPNMFISWGRGGCEMSTGGSGSALRAFESRRSCEHTGVYICRNLCPCISS